MGRGGGCKSWLWEIWQKIEEVEEKKPVECSARLGSEFEHLAVATFAVTPLSAYDRTLIRTNV
ncbi:hypothetical protein PTI98_009536 [Pleurotus ostreatus]|nr:hypothetical protein PTI98_009536 [Pleurotus ostreatus]